MEEQYYIVWPLILFVWAKAFPCTRRAGVSLMEHQDAKAAPMIEQVREIGSSAGGCALPAHAASEMEKGSKCKRSSDPNAADGERGCHKTTTFEIPPSFLRALFLGECMVILVSYVSSLATIEMLGMSAAYYATWSRMGDIAIGGLIFILIRWQPAVYRLYTRRQLHRHVHLHLYLCECISLSLCHYPHSLSPVHTFRARTHARARAHTHRDEPMTTSFRIVLELLWVLALCLLIFPPMVQAPLADVLPVYFRYFRLPFGFMICAGTAAGMHVCEPAEYRALSRCQSKNEVR